MTIAALLLGALAAGAVAAPDCSIDRAVYRLNGAPEFTAGFARQDRRKTSVSDLVFWLRTPARTFWFSFGSPNGYGGTYLAPELDPRISARLSDDEEWEASQRMHGGEPLDIPFDAFGSDLAALRSPPNSENAAPALLFARNLGSMLWYNPTGLAGGDASAREESMPIGLFTAAGCDGPPPEAR